MCNVAKKIGLISMLLVLVGGCQGRDESSIATQVEQKNSAAVQTATENPIAAQALDATTPHVASCMSDHMQSVAISSVSWTDTGKICTAYARAAGEMPTVKSLRTLSTAASNLEALRHVSSTVSAAQKFVDIAQIRGKLTDEDAFVASTEVAFKIVNGTEGKIPLDTVFEVLQSLGPGSKTISDRGLINAVVVASDAR